MASVVPAFAGTQITVAYGNFAVVRPYRLPRRREFIVGGLVPRLRGEDGGEVGRDLDGLERYLDVRRDFAQVLSQRPAPLESWSAG